MNTIHEAVKSPSFPRSAFGSVAVKKWLNSTTVELSADDDDLSLPVGNCRKFGSL